MADYSQLSQAKLMAKLTLADGQLKARDDKIYQLQTDYQTVRDIETQLQADLDRNKGILADKIKLEQQYRGENRDMKRELQAQEDDFKLQVTALKQKVDDDTSEIMSLKKDVDYYVNLHQTQAFQQTNPNVTGRNLAPGGTLGGGLGRNPRRLTLPLFDVPIVTPPDFLPNQAEYTCFH